MWFFNFHKFITLKKTKNRYSVLIYSSHIILILTFYILKIWKNFFFINRNLISKKFYTINNEINIIRIKYIGKIFRIRKKNKILYLALNYAKKHFLIHKNIKIKFKKKKKTFFFFFNTNTNIKFNLFKNLTKLRYLNTYTKRGVYNNLFIYYKRKKKLTNTR